jgi:mannose-6-phosphate isomerase-like protein (cupin superfamily)
MISAGLHSPAMARAGDDGMILGERLTFRETGRDGDGEFLRFEFSHRRGGIGSRRHVHPRQSERHEVLEGTLGLEVEGEEHRLGPGDVLLVPAGVPHRAFPVGGREVISLIELRPPMKYEAIFNTFTALRGEGKLTRRGFPRNPLLGALIFREHEDETHFTFPPRVIQRALLGPLAALGRSLGYGTDGRFHD